MGNHASLDMNRSCRSTLPTCTFCSSQFQKGILTAKSGCFNSCTTVILNVQNLINFVAVKVDPSKTLVSCATCLNNFWGLIWSRAWISCNFSSVSTFLFNCLFTPLNLWPATFSQVYIHMTSWELVRLDTYNETLKYSFCKFFPCICFNNEYTLFSGELHFNKDVHCLPHLWERLEITALETSDMITNDACL